MNPTYDFTGQVALVTGASSGMGLATARAFAQAGAAVVLADINHDALSAATDDLTARRPPSARRRPATSPTRTSVAATVAGRSRHLRPARHGVQQRRHPGPAHATPPTNPPRCSTGSTRSTCAACGPA